MSRLSLRAPSLGRMRPWVWGGSSLRGVVPQLGVRKIVGSFPGELWSSKECCQLDFTTKKRGKLGKKSILEKQKNLLLILHCIVTPKFSLPSFSGLITPVVSFVCQLPEISSVLQYSGCKYCRGRVALGGVPRN